jgi:NAD(P)H-hydrate epimerase
MPPLHAAAAAVWVHGSAGDLCRSELGERAMTPSDLIGRFAAVLKPLE